MDIPPRYLCDPTKNTECRKTACYINDGPCCFTTDPKFKIEGTKGVSNQDIKTFYDILLTIKGHKKTLI